MVSSSIQVFVTFPAGIPSRRLTVDPETRLSALLPTDNAASPLLYIRTRNGIPTPSQTVGSLLSAPGQKELDVDVQCRVLGGKGGFGAMLRATGGRMSSQKASNNDSCRDLSGRRLSTVKEAKKMATVVELEAEAKKKAAEAAKAKLEALERHLGISGSSSKAKDGEASSSKVNVTSDDLAQLAGKKHKFDDNEYLEESRELNDNVRSAVSAGLLKKRKKAKLAASANVSSGVTVTAEDSAPVATLPAMASNTLVAA